MLRITPIEKNGSPIILKLEGKVHAEWVALLEQECLALLAQKKPVALDLSKVTYVDERGVKMMQKLRVRRVELINSSGFVHELLDGGGRS